jgi:D-alanyl-D-alanine carboxypeptidase
MILMKTLLLSGALAAAALGWPATADRPAAPRETLPGIVHGLTRDGAPGALAVVRTPSGVARAESGLARRRPRTPMAAGERFRVASITKTFVATVVLQLVAEQRLRLDDAVERWLPGLVPNGRAITIRQLLAHTSGLTDYQDDARFVRAVLDHPLRPWPPRRLVAVATAHEPVFAPGQGWSYSNTNYIVLGLVVETVTGATVEDEVQHRVVQPLGLTQTTFPRDPRIRGRHAHGYIGSDTLSRLRSLVDATTAVTPSIGWAAGAIVSTGNDLTRFYAALLHGQLLPTPVLAAMKSSSPGARYGLGLMVFDTSCGRAYGHVGIAAGYRTVLYARPDGSRVAVVMINVDGTYVAQGELEAAAERAFCSGAGSRA